MTYDLIFNVLGLVVVGAPAALMVVMGLTTLLGRPLNERMVGRAVQCAVTVGLVASVVMLAMMLLLGRHHVPIELSRWVELPPAGHGAATHGSESHAVAESATVSDEYHFHIQFVFDRLSVPFVILTFVLCGTIGAFANRYMHHEPGFNRFFTLYALFLLGMVVTSMAGTIETLFSGWEMVGLSSALLVAFYHERPAPVRNGLRVWIVYRISDAALLLASIVLHRIKHLGDFEAFLGSTHWPGGTSPLTSYEALLVGSLLLVAAAGKSALVPFSGWLPRAMEGPTPSSAVFYGALSVHLGAFLLLRFSPIIVLSPVVGGLTVAIGLVTAAFAAFAGRVQTDIKCALTFASLTQVGLIVAEIGMGWYYFALIHILGHGCLRTLQFLRAPSLLVDYRAMENAMGDRVQNASSFWMRLIPERLRTWLYRLALERGYLDALLSDLIVVPFIRVMTWCDTMERKWTAYLTVEPDRQTQRIQPPTSTYEESI